MRCGSNSVKGNRRVRHSGAATMVFPWFGLPAHLDDVLAIGGIFTGVSILRSFALRRLFEAIRIRSAE